MVTNWDFGTPPSPIIAHHKTQALQNLFISNIYLKNEIKVYILSKSDGSSLLFCREAALYMSQQVVNTMKKLEERLGNAILFSQTKYLTAEKTYVTGTLHVDTNDNSQVIKSVKSRKGRLKSNMGKNVKIWKKGRYALYLSNPMKTKWLLVSKTEGMKRQILCKL